MRHSGTERCRIFLLRKTAQLLPSTVARCPRLTGLLPASSSAQSASYPPSANTSPTLAPSASLPLSLTASLTEQLNLPLAGAAPLRSSLINMRLPAPPAAPPPSWDGVGSLPSEKKGSILPGSPQHFTAGTASLGPAEGGRPHPFLLAISFNVGCGSHGVFMAPGDTSRRFLLTQVLSPAKALSS